MIYLEVWFGNIYTEITERLVIDGFNIFYQEILEPSEVFLNL